MEFVSFVFKNGPIIGVALPGGSLAYTVFKVDRKPGQPDAYRVVARLKTKADNDGYRVLASLQESGQTKGFKWRATSAIQSGHAKGPAVDPWWEALIELPNEGPARIVLPKGDMSGQAYTQRIVDDGGAMQLPKGVKKASFFTNDGETES